MPLISDERAIKVYPTTVVCKSINNHDADADIPANQHHAFQVALVARLLIMLSYDVTICWGIVTLTTPRPVDPNNICSHISETIRCLVMSVLIYMYIVDEE